MRKMLGRFSRLRPNRPSKASKLLRFELLEDRRLLAVAVSIDYSMDNGFFNDTSRRALLQNALDSVVSQLMDNLPAVPSNTYSVQIPGGSTASKVFSVPADTIKLFVAGAALSGSTLGRGGPQYSTGGPRPSTSTDFQPIYGRIAFDSDGSTDWYFGTGNTPAEKIDFRSVAIHEFLHVLGIVGGQSSWASQISGGYFTGPKTRAANAGSNLQVEPGAKPGHFAEGSGAFMDPAYDAGESMTKLDWAALDDIGWTLGASSNTFATAEPLFSRDTGAVITNIDLAESGGVKLFRIEAYSLFNLTATTSANGNGNHDTYLRLFDSQGTEINSDDDSGTGSFSTLSHSFESGSGVYYLGVSLYSNRSYNPVTGGSSAAGKFKIALEMTDSDFGGTLGTAYATELSGSSGTFEKAPSLEWEYDQDMFELNATAGTSLSVNTFKPTFSPWSTDTYLRLFDSTGRELHRADTGGPGKYAAFSYQIPATGKYFVGVSTSLNWNYDPREDELGGDLSSNDGGDYQIKIVLTPSFSLGEGNSVGTEFPEVLSRAPDGGWWISQSNGSRFIETRPYGVWNPSAGWVDVQYGDFSGDGISDVLGRTANGQWWLGRSNGDQFENVYYGQWNAAANWADVTSTDFDGDGNLDIIGRAQDGTWWLARNNLTGLTSQPIGSFNPTAGWRDVNVGDFTGDGRPDIAARTSGGAWYVAVNNGGNSTVSAYWGNWNEAANWRSVRIGDFSGDGRADILGRTSAGGWFLARSTGSSFASAPYGYWTEGAGWTDVMAADFANDGKPDIVGRTAAGEWYVGVNNGSSLAFQYYGHWSPTGNWRDVMAGNFAGGGKADLLGRTSDGAWYIARNSQPGFSTTLAGLWSPLNWVNTTANHFYGAHVHDDGAVHTDSVGGAPLSIAYGDSSRTISPGDQQAVDARTQQSSLSQGPMLPSGTIARLASSRAFDAVYAQLGSRDSLATSRFYFSEDLEGRAKKADVYFDDPLLNELYARV